MGLWDWFGGRSTSNGGFSQLGVRGIGTPLMQVLASDAISPGDEPGYQTCKVLYEYHPLGKKMVDAPISMAMSQARIIKVGRGGDPVTEAFEAKAREIGSDAIAAQHARLARMYGYATITVLVEGQDTNAPLDLDQLAKIGGRKRIAFNVLDPLNTASGTSAFLSQDPNSPDFNKPSPTVVAGKAYHPTRACVLRNEDQLYISFTSSAFSFSGRSVYQRALYPMKSFVTGMITDDMVATKAGLLIEKVKAPGSQVDAISAQVIGQKRTMLKGATVGNVMSIGVDETIETLDMQNLEGPYGLARKHMLENVALAADMPAKILNSETFAEGFGEGTEDAKYIARFVNSFRIWMAPSFTFLDRIVQRLAWTPEFFKTQQALRPEEYGPMTYEQAFYQWANSFEAYWPSLIEEPDSEKIKVDDVILRAIIAAAELLLPLLDPENRINLIRFIQDGLNDRELLFKTPLAIDFDLLEAWEPPTVAGQEGEEPGEPSINKADSRQRTSAALIALKDSVAEFEQRGTLNQRRMAS